jgi:hypothetical protein
LVAQTAADYDGDLTGVIAGYNGSFNHYGSGTITSVHGGLFQAFIRPGGGDVTNMYGGKFFVKNQSVDGDIANAYGMYVEDVNDGTALNYAIYTNAGDVRIGGDQYFEGAGSGLPYGEISGEGVADPIDLAAGIGNKTQITSSDTNGESNLTTPSHGDGHITILKTGVYFIAITMHVESDAGAARTVGFSAYTNDGANQLANVHGHEDFAGGSGETKTVTLSGSSRLAANDTVEVWAWNVAGATDIVIEDITMTVFMVGG